jgi:hypothetical protein
MSRVAFRVFPAGRAGDTWAAIPVHSRAKPKRTVLLDVSAKPIDLYKVWSFLTIKWRYAPFFKVPRIAILVPFGY